MQKKVKGAGALWATPKWQALPRRQRPRGTVAAEVELRSRARSVKAPSSSTSTSDPSSSPPRRRRHRRKEGQEGGGGRAAGSRRRRGSKPAAPGAHTSTAGGGGNQRHGAHAHAARRRPHDGHSEVVVVDDDGVKTRATEQGGRLSATPLTPWPTSSSHRRRHRVAGAGEGGEVEGAAQHSVADQESAGGSHRRDDRASVLPGAASSAADVGARKRARGGKRWGTRSGAA